MNPPKITLESLSDDMSSSTESSSEGSKETESPSASISNTSKWRKENHISRNCESCNKMISCHVCGDTHTTKRKYVTSLSHCLRCQDKWRKDRLQWGKTAAALAAVRRNGVQWAKDKSALTLLQTAHKDMVGKLQQQLRDVEDYLEKSSEDCEDLTAELLSLRSRVKFMDDWDPESQNQLITPDVIFSVEGRSLGAHRVILAGNSSVFRRMFESDMLEGRTGQIVIDDASFMTMRALILYCYRAEVSFIDGVLPEEVLSVAHKYDVPALQLVCEEELCQFMDGEIYPGLTRTLPALLKLSNRYCAGMLRAKLLACFRQQESSTQIFIWEQMFMD